MKATREELKKLDRLKKRSDFLLVNANAANPGGKWVSKSMIVLAVPNGLDVKRVGFTATKKTDKSAVVRNRMKRRLRAVAADVLANNAKTGMDYVLLARQDTATRPYEELTRDLLWCIRKMGHAVE